MQASTTATSKYSHRLSARNLATLQLKSYQNVNMAALSSIHVGNVQKLLISFIFRRSGFSKQHSAVSRYSTEVSEGPYPKKNEEELALIEKKRNKSGLPDHFRDQMEVNQRGLPEVKYDYHFTTRYIRRMYAKFGRASGIDPSIMWPTRQQIEEQIEEEKVFHPPLKEMVERRREFRMQEQETIMKREQTVAYNMSQLDKWLNDLKQRRDKKLAALQAQKDKREEIIEEVRQYFGYRLNPNDPKFQEVLEKKEKEEKKAAREAKKKERFAREMLKLASLAQQSTEGAEPGKTALQKTSPATTPKLPESND